MWYKEEETERKPPPNFLLLHWTRRITTISLKMASTPSTFRVLFLVKQYGRRIFVIAIRNLRPIECSVPPGFISYIFPLLSFGIHFSRFESLFPSIAVFWGNILKKRYCKAILYFIHKGKGSRIRVIDGENLLSWFTSPYRGFFDIYNNNRPSWERHILVTT